MPKGSDTRFHRTEVPVGRPFSSGGSSSDLRAISTVYSQVKFKISRGHSKFHLDDDWIAIRTDGNNTSPKRRVARGGEARSPARRSRTRRRALSTTARRRLRASRVSNAREVRSHVSALALRRIARAGF
eukprot:31409-Pelagococcus_subviridis.AAC.5